MNDNINDVPIIENKTDNVKNSDFIRLHDEIIELVYKFMSEHDIAGAWELHFSIDDLESLKKYGSNCPACDTSLTIFDMNQESIICSM